MKEALIYKRNCILSGWWKDSIFTLEQLTRIKKMEDKKQKNCPFCGRKVFLIVNYIGREGYKAYIKCKCGWSLECVDYDRNGASIDALSRWNSAVVNFLGNEKDVYERNIS